jgi:hypothetical protein
MELFSDLLPSLNLKTRHLIDEDKNNEKDYNAFIVNKALSYFMDSLVYVNEMNFYNSIDKLLQYDFLYYGVPKAKRFKKGKWEKPETINNFDIVKEYYKCSDKKAKEYVAILTDEQIKTIKKKLFKGG